MAISYLVLVRAESEVANRLAGVLGAAKEQSVGASGLLKRKLVKGEGLASGSEDACAGRSGEAEGSNIKLRNLEETVVVCDGADDNDSLLLVAVLDVGGDAGEGHGRAVDAAHKQPAENDLVEGRVGTTYSS